MSKLFKNSRRKFHILEWLKVDEDSLLQNAYKDYEKYEIRRISKNNDKTEKAIQEDVEKIIIETEAALTNAERHVEDDEFEHEFSFQDLGYNTDLIVDYILTKNEFDDTFKKLLRKQANRAKLKILDNDVMKQDEMEMAIKKPWKIPINQRWRLYRYFVQQFCKEQKLLLDEEKLTFADLQEKYTKEKQKVDREILMQSGIIAMTTSGAARYQDVLKEIGPRIIIVEEAAEVMEAHIIATLNPNCEHLILIGDHKQLEPKPAVFELAEKFNLSLSMFERMINVGLPYVCLERQHRMRPEISQLVRPVYDKLVDNENVFEYEDVLGIEKNVYFIMHNKEEGTRDETQSYWNNHEANYIQGLLRYLLLQGYKTSQITILTPYSGQMFLLRDLMPKKEFDGIRISILDNFQGEENDIILLSLVRSNKEGKIGFLIRENRVCVALSRAKIGLYIIGNFDIIEKFSGKCKLWGKAIKTVKEMGAIGDGLPLICRVHSTRIQAVSSVDFEMSPEGGCSLRCDIKRQCGHDCPLFCHPRDTEHKNIECKKTCLQRCDSGHTCEKQCHFPSKCNCNVQIEKRLPCQHKKNISCCTPPETVACREQVIKDLLCGHTGEMYCNESPEDFICKQLVERTLDCGHIKEFPCYFNYKRYNCEIIMRKKLPCGHEGDVHCWRSATRYKCKELVHRVLKCSHEIDLACHIDVENYVKCTGKVVKKLSCGHECELLCDQSLHSVKCMERITEKRTVSYTSISRFGYPSYRERYTCDHLFTRFCYQSAGEFQTRNLCKEFIKKTLRCGHMIEVACHLRDDDITCKATVMTNFQCHHDNVPVACHEKPNTKCHAKCGKLCLEEHTCQEMCHFPEPCVCRVKVQKQHLCGHSSLAECSTDVSTLPCKELVEKKLKCGHNTMIPCNVDVDKSNVPCLKEVLKELKCEHELLLPCNVSRDDPSIKCHKKVEKIRPSCGHKSLMSCFSDAETEECHTEVNFVRQKCGHETKILCCLEKKFKDSHLEHFELPMCETLVHVTLPCGHVSEVPCFKKEKNLLPCMKPCKSVLFCGHVCSGTCSECSNNYRHKECQEICTKALVCGHNCTSRHCGDCGPCSESCNFVCSHRICDHPCNKKCENCTKRCEWNCQHYTCSKPCFEICDRPKCNERCIKRLKCGHQCIGFCGDPCPKLCKKCDSTSLMKLSKVKSHLFVELQDCGHIFNSKILDDYIELTEETFSVKRCPKCCKVINWHPRYSVELKNQRLKTNEIRNTIQTASGNLKVSIFPLLLSNGNSSFNFVAKLSTFLSANEQSLQQTNSYVLAKRILGSLDVLLREKSYGNQRYYSIYSMMMKLSLLWKVVIVEQYNCFHTFVKLKLKEKTLEKDVDFYDSDYSDETSESEGESIVQTRCKGEDECQTECLQEGLKMHGEYEEFKRNLDVIKKYCLKLEDRGTFLESDIEEKLQFFIPFLTDLGKGWNETANKFPRLTTVIDVHSGSWRTCPFGHLFSCIIDLEYCIACHGFEQLFMSDFQNQQKLNEDYERQGARPKGPQNRKEDTPSNQRSNNQIDHNISSTWSNTDLDASNQTSRKRGNNPNRGNRYYHFLPSSPETANLYSFFFRGVFGRGRGSQQDNQNPIGMYRKEWKGKREGTYTTRYSLPPRYQLDTRGAWHTETEHVHVNQSQGNRSAGRGKGGKRGESRGRR